MPNLDGMSLGKIINKFTNRPYIVFITASKELAFEAFEIQAFDYILKPYSEDRIKKTLKRLEESHDSAKVSKENKISERKITLWNNNKLIVINTNEIYYCEAKDRDTIIHTKNDEYVANMCISNFLKDLPQNLFFRSHRSYIINLDKIKEIIPWFNNTYNLKLIDKATEIPVSRSNIKEFRKLMRI